jgi:hypothetical protein
LPALQAACRLSIPANVLIQSALLAAEGSGKPCGNQVETWWKSLALAAGLGFFFKILSEYCAIMDQKAAKALCSFRGVPQIAAGNCRKTASEMPEAASFSSFI